MLSDDRNSILFVGYCDPSTPGGQLIEAEHGSSFEFEAFDCTLPIKATIKQFDLSGHADRDQLVAYAEKLSPKNIFLHHGDPDARKWFAEALAPTGAEIIDPAPLQFYET